MTTGDRIKAARKKAGLTQKELGKRLGISYQTLAQWENNLRNPKMETLDRIATALNISISYLLGNQDIDGFLLPTNFADPSDYEFIKALGLDCPIKKPNEQEQIIIIAEAAADAVLSLLAHFDELDDHNKDRALTCLRTMTGLPFIEGQDVKEQLITSYLSLNEEGRQKAIERVEELTEIPKYQRKAAPSDATTEASKEEE